MNSWSVTYDRLTLFAYRQNRLVITNGSADSVTRKCPEMSYVSRKDASSQLLFAIHILVKRQEAMPTSITGTKRFEYTHLID